MIGRRPTLAGLVALATQILACADRPASPKKDKAMAPPPDAAAPAPPRQGALSMVSDEVGAYTDAHTIAESATMRAIAEETHASTDMAVMMIGPLEAALLRLLVRLTAAKRVLEIGTFTGYSAIAMAEGMGDGGELITCDISEEWTSIAKKHWATSPHGKKIRLELRPATETLQKLKPPFDVTFIDADKGAYPDYWDGAVPLTRPGGLIIVDNVLRGGTVADPADERGRPMAAFNKKVREDKRVETLMLPIRDGVTIAQKI